MYCFACRLFKMSLENTMIGREINHYWPAIDWTVTLSLATPTFIDFIFGHIHFLALTTSKIPDISMLLSASSPATFKVSRASLAQNTQMEENSYREIVVKMNQYYNPPPSPFVQQFHFNLC